MKSVFKALAIAALGAAPALAQDWSGKYVGVTGGVASLATDWTDSDYTYFGGTYMDKRSNLNGGIQAGRNSQKGNIVLGWELDYRPGHVYIHTDFGDNPPGVDLEKIDALRHLITLRGRYGLAVDNALVYATAGIARGDIKHSLTSNGNPFAGESTPVFYNKQIGWAYGAGLEHRLSDRTSLRMEYLAAGWPSKTITNNNGSPYTQRDRVTLLTVGLNLHY